MVCVAARPVHTMTGMLILAAKVWHYWIAVPLVVGIIGATIATFVGYLKKVQSPRYPNGKQ
jgi:hypothetical protein